MRTPTVYLDYASHTPPSNEALEAFLRGARDFAGNANARHSAGESARREVARVAAGIARLVGCEAEEVLFTTGASEGNYRAITGIARAYRHAGRHILSTVYAHPSEGAALAELVEAGWEVEHIRVKSDGMLDLAHLAEAIRDDTVLVCVSAADSELGAVQDLTKIAEIASAHRNCHLHIDAAQAMGKIAVPTFSQLGAATMTFSAHKFYGVGGNGVLLRRKGIMLDGFYEGGTPAPGVAAACYTALETALREREKRWAYVTELRNRVLDELAHYPHVRINSPAFGSPYILNLSADGVRGTAFRDALNARGVCVSVKAACADENSPSRPVQAISDRKNALQAWRVSFSHLTTAEEIERFLSIFKDIYNNFSSGSMPHA